MEKIKLPRSSYEEIAKIISAYGARKVPSSLDDIAHATGINRTAISANNAFLTFVEVIEGGVKKNITSKGMKLSQALEHEMAEQIEEAWTEIIAENDFLSKMLQALKIRRGMELSQFENHIAYSSGEIKSAAVMTGARAVVDILLHSGVLRREGDKLLADSSKPLGSVEGREETPSASTPVTNIHMETAAGGDKTNINLNIDLSISAEPDQLADLGQKIKALIDTIKGSD
jgi:hypothetical protein